MASRVGAAGADHPRAIALVFGDVRGAQMVIEPRFREGLDFPDSPPAPRERAEELLVEHALVRGVLIDASRMLFPIVL